MVARRTIKYCPVSLVSQQLARSSRTAPSVSRTPRIRIRTKREAKPCAECTEKTYRCSLAYLNGRKYRPLRRPPYKPSTTDHNNAARPTSVVIPLITGGSMVPFSNEHCRAWETLCILLLQMLQCAKLLGKFRNCLYLALASNCSCFLRTVLNALPNRLFCRSRNIQAT